MINTCDVFSTSISVTTMNRERTDRWRRIHPNREQFDRISRNASFKFRKLVDYIIDMSAARHSRSCIAETVAWLRSLASEESSGHVLQVELVQHAKAKTACDGIRWLVLLLR